MKIMIVHASAGGGHRTAAEALYNSFKDDHKDVNVEIVDILDYSDYLFSYFYSVGYRILATHLKLVWFVFYYISTVAVIRNLFQFISLLHCRKFIDYLVLNKPDVVLTTHFLTPYIVSYLRQKKKISSRLITVITDFRAHPIWISRKCDYYAVACDHTASDLVRQGVSSSKISVSGIPVDKGFRDLARDEDPGMDKGNVRGAGEGGFRVLLATGSLGFMLMEDIADMLHKKVKLTVVCGRNKILLKHLESKNYPNVKLFGYTNQMPELMAQADIMITKPGGLSISEALIMNLPLIFIDGIPGQETGNIKVMQDYGCAIPSNNLNKLNDIIVDLKNSPQKLESVRAKIRKIRKPGACEEIYKLCMFR